MKQAILRLDKAEGENNTYIACKWLKNNTEIWEGRTCFDSASLLSSHWTDLMRQSKSVFEAVSPDPSANNIVIRGDMPLVLEGWRIIT